MNCFYFANEFLICQRQLKNCICPQMMTLAPEQSPLLGGPMTEFSPASSYYFIQFVSNRDNCKSIIKGVVWNSYGIKHFQNQYFFFQAGQTGLVWTCTTCGSPAHDPMKRWYTFFKNRKCRKWCGSWGLLFVLLKRNLTEMYLGGSLTQWVGSGTQKPERSFTNQGGIKLHLR